VVLSSLSRRQVSDHGRLPPEASRGPRVRRAPGTAADRREERALVPSTERPAVLGIAERGRPRCGAAGKGPRGRGGPESGVRLPPPARQSSGADPPSPRGLLKIG